MRLMLIGLALVAGLYCAVVLLAYGFQRSLLYFPDQSAFDEETIAQQGVEAISVRTAGRPESISLWLSPDNADQPVILYLHGNAGSVFTRFQMYRYMARDGAGVLAAGYPGYGGNAGNPDESSLYATAQANYDWLIESGFKPDQIVIVGQSLGSGVATWLAEKNDAAGLILEAAFTGMDDMGQRQFPFLPAKLLIKDKYRSVDRIDQIAMPLSWIHGTRDELIPFAMGQRLFDAAAEPKWSHPIKNGGHNDLWQLGIDRIIRDDANRFVADKRNGAGPD